MSILHGAGRPGQGHRRVYIIVRQPYAYLADLLQRAFEGQTEVEIIVDRRRGERRTTQQPVAVERRGADRRRRRVELLQVCIGTLLKSEAMRPAT